MSGLLFAASQGNWIDIAPPPVTASGPRAPPYAHAPTLSLTSNLDFLEEIQNSLRKRFISKQISDRRVTRTDFSLNPIIKTDIFVFPSCFLPS